MQPKNNRSRASSNASHPAPVLATARDAWFRGDFETCLTILDGAAAIVDDREQREAILLRACALLRLRRAGEALSLLGPVLGTFRGADEVSTARMLHGEGVARVQNVDRGLKLLCELYADSDALSAHRAIRGEIAYKLAFVHWMKREHRETLRYALVAEAAQADIISVRAAFLRGFVAAARERYAEALALFNSALQKYRLSSSRAWRSA